MLTVIIIMCAGIALGYLIQNRKRWVRLADRLTMWAIYILLFLLGIAIGTNEVIVKNLPTLGLKALLISMGGVLGSVLVAWLAYRLWFAPKDSGHERESYNSIVFCCGRGAGARTPLVTARALGDQL